MSVGARADEGGPVGRYRQRLDRVLRRKILQLGYEPVFHPFKVVAGQLGTVGLDHDGLEVFVARVKLIELVVVHGGLLVGHAYVDDGDGIFHGHSPLGTV